MTEQSITGRVRVISTRGSAVIRSCYCRADRNSTQAHTTAHVGSAISAAAINTPYASYASYAPHASYASHTSSPGEGIG